MPKVPYFRPSHVEITRRSARKRYERRADRQEAKNFYSSTTWIRLRDAHRAEHPLCEPCLSRSRTTPVDHVHHKIPRESRPDLALDPSNLESVCLPCHNRKPER